MDKSHVGMTSCFLCGGNKDILIDRQLRNVLPRDCGVMDLEPCNSCKDYMSQGVIVIGVDEDKTDFDKTIMLPNPDKKSELDRHPSYVDSGVPDFYRTGHYVVVAEHFMDRLAEDVGNPEAENTFRSAKEKRVLFMDYRAMDSIGLIDTSDQSEG